ncbi:MAG TPA: hypothetical protein PK762_00610 [Candidatus Kapabacteria bacterium]|nr:hypothetical protein [Candidatus Kapabacteria bacterium]
MFLSFITLYSQVPQTISWQGIIQDSDGNLLNEQVNLTLKLFEAATGGTAVWTELHQNHSINNGLANIILGSVTPLQLDFDKQYWLEITIDESTPLPRIKLNAVPYSLYSARTSGIIVNDSIVLKDSLGITRMVFNPNTGTFKMMDNDTVWYEMKVQSPPTTTTRNPDGSYSKKRGIEQWDYDNNDNLVYRKTVSDDGNLIEESWFSNNDIYKAETTINSENEYTITTENFIERENQTTVYSKTQTLYKEPANVDGIANVMLKTTETEYILGSTEPPKTKKISGTTSDGNFIENYWDGQRISREVSFVNEESTVLVEITNATSGTRKKELITYHNNSSLEVKSVEKEYLNNILKQKTEHLADGRYKVYRYNDDGSLINGGLFSPDGQLVSAWDGSQSGITTQTTPTGFSVGRYFPTAGAPVCNVGPTWDNTGFIVGYQTYNGVDRANMVLGYNDVGINTSPTGNIQLNSNTNVTGNANVSGNLNVTGTKNFLIEHPTQTDKYLVHAAIESNEVLNQYSGNVMTNTEGLATITLPDYFNEINLDFRYQLTIVGASFARAIIFEEINNNNKFTIKTDEPNIKVSWQVTAKRNDKYLREHPFFEIIDKE